MSDHTYVRKAGIAGPASPMDGSPNLPVLVEQALPGFTFCLRASGEELTASFDAELTPAEVALLDAAYAAWEPADLARYKRTLMDAMDRECERRIVQSPGFEWPPGSGQFFSTSTNAQIKWSWLVQYRDSFNYSSDPPRVRTKDDLVDYTLTSAIEVFQAGGIGLTTVRPYLTASNDAKGLVIAASTREEADAAFDAYMDGP